MTEGCKDAIGACEEALDNPKKVLETCEEEAGICAEELDVDTPIKVLDSLVVDGGEGVKVRCVVDNGAVVLNVEYRVAVPLIHVVFAVIRSHKPEDTGLFELSQSQYTP